jgi:outer membrane protein TolC
VINAQADLVRAHTAVIEAQAQVAQARVRLARAAGVTLSLE